MTGSRILVTGASGQLAMSFRQMGAIAGYDLIACGRPEFDLANPESIRRIFDEVNPSLVINTAAYTAVDQAESDVDEAFSVNAHGVGFLAELCTQKQIAMIHVSTDYVFDGVAKTPYQTSTQTSPQNIYGKSKYEGEVILRSSLEHHLIFRTAWVFSEYGSNFLKTMLRVAQKTNQLRVIDDQYGAPTFASDLADGIARIATQVLTGPSEIQWGTYHLTNSGWTTWCGFAREIFSHDPTLSKTPIEVEAIATADYPTLVSRPAFSVLDCGKTETNFGVILPHWQDATKRCLEKLKEANK